MNARREFLSPEGRAVGTTAVPRRTAVPVSTLVATIAVALALFLSGFNCALAQDRPDTNASAVERKPDDTSPAADSSSASSPNVATDTNESVNGANLASKDKGSPDDMKPSEAIKFYGMMDPGHTPSTNQQGPLRGVFKDHPGLRRFLGFRPWLQWYTWANRHQPFVPSLVFIFLFGNIVSFVFPKMLKNAEEQCRNHYWKSLISGAIIVMITLWLVRMSVMTHFGWPMGIFLAGTLQFLLMCGVGVLVSILGRSLGYYLKVDELLSERAVLRQMTCLLLGALVCALVLQIPGVGTLPKIGSRLLGLLAVLGLGAIFRARSSRT